MPMLGCDWPRALGANRCSDTILSNHSTEGVNTNAPIQNECPIVLNCAMMQGGDKWAIWEQNQKGLFEMVQIWHMSQ